jgi:hypothetical protein
MRLLQVLRLFIVTFAIVINCSPNGDALQLPNQCRIKVPGGETVVSWWVLLTKSTQDAKQAQHRLWYKPVDQNVVSVRNKFFSGCVHPFFFLFSFFAFSNFHRQFTYVLMHMRLVK